MKEIKLTRGQVALVDDADFEELSKFKWYARKHYHTWYAARSSYPVNKRCGIIYMHVQIMGFPAREVDHRDRNGLHNWRKNLRAASRSQQMANSSRPNPTGYRGVTAHRNGFFVRITKDCVNHYLGYFSDKRAAALAYDKAAIRLHGEFAVLNFPKS